MFSSDKRGRRSRAILSNSLIAAKDDRKAFDAPTRSQDAIAAAMGIREGKTWGKRVGAWRNDDGNVVKRLTSRRDVKLNSP